MEFFGRLSVGAREPVRLHEVTVVLDRDEVARLIEFLGEVGREMRANSEWEHAHLNDFLANNESGGLVIFSKTALPKVG